MISSSDESEDFDDVIDVTPRKRRDISRTTPSRSEEDKYHNALNSASLQTKASTNTAAKFLRVQIPLGEAVRQRESFQRRLNCLDGPPVTLVNEIDETTPSTDFKFIDDSIHGPDVEKVSEEFMIGCTCYIDSRNIGCEYGTCQCLADAKKKGGHTFFPYSKPDRIRGLLRDWYLGSRNHIYECNKHCKCAWDACKNRNVQYGRQVPLEIFKTRNRGWGM